jgi:hypothetical protein
VTWITSQFASEAGTPICPDNIGPRYMEPALEHAGLRKFRFHEVAQDTDAEEVIWLPPRDSNPDMLIQSQLSCR